MNRIFVILAVAVLALSSCGSKSQKAEHNDADLQFARHTIEGHQVSIETVNFALPNINGPDVKKLAEEIKSGEEEVLKSMEKLLHEWGVHEKPHAQLPEHERHELQEAHGTELDRVFLRLMIEHHKKAIETTEAVIGKGKNKEVEKLSHEMLRTQERELEELEKELVSA